MPKQPHIIIVNPDEMRWDTMAHMGNPAAITPNLDAFAAEDAVSFRNAFCQNPVCVPSRCSFFTGLYPHVNGHRTMSYLLRPGETTLLKELKEAGYHVWMNDRNDLTAGQYEGWTESHADEIYYAGKRPPIPLKTADGSKPKDMRGEPGGKYYYSHFGGQLGVDENGKNESGDDRTIDAAAERIAQWKEGDAPLCMFLGLTNPHCPYEIEEPYYSAVDRSKLPPRVQFDDCSGKSRMMELYHKYQNLQDLTEDEWNEIRAVYLGMCMKVDEEFGRLCDALKKAGIYDDSAIFFFSDHGDFAGDYGMAEKAQNCLEDCLTRVPFLVKPPKDFSVDAGISDSLVELVDFYATVMDMAGVKPAHTHFGKSLLPVLADRKTEIREYAFSEGGRMPGEEHCDEYHQGGGRVAQPNDLYWPKKKAQSDDVAHAKAVMIRSHDYKYISRSLGEDELYDLKADPGETTNRINDPELAPVLAKYQIALMKWLQGTSDIVPFDYDNRWTGEMLWAKMSYSVPPEYADDVHEKMKNGMDMRQAYAYIASLQKH